MVIKDEKMSFKTLCDMNASCSSADKSMQLSSGYLNSNNVEYSFHVPMLTEACVGA